LGEALTIAIIDGRTPGAANASAVARAGSATAIATHPSEIIDALVKGKEIPCWGPSGGPSAVKGFPRPLVQPVAGLEGNSRVVKYGVSWVESLRLRLDILAFDVG
jgi:hypothetical protein